MSDDNIAYVTTEADRLLLLCAEVLKQSAHPDDLVIRGTLPKADLEYLLGSIRTHSLDATRFSKPPANLRNWSEFCSLGAAVYYYNHHYRNTRIVKGDERLNVHFKAAIGVEDRYHSGLLEAVLGDGFIFDVVNKSGLIVQQCRAQVEQGPHKGMSLEQEVVRVVNEKIKRRNDYPADCALLVTVIPSQDASLNDISFKNVAEACPDIMGYDPVLFIAYEGSYDVVKIIRFDPSLDTSEKFKSAVLRLVISNSVTP